MTLGLLSSKTKKPGKENRGELRGWGQMKRLGDTAPRGFCQRHERKDRDRARGWGWTSARTRERREVRINRGGTEEKIKDGQRKGRQVTEFMRTKAPADDLGGKRRPERKEAPRLIGGRRQTGGKGITTSRSTPSLLRQRATTSNNKPGANLSKKSGGRIKGVEHLILMYRKSWWSQEKKISDPPGTGKINLGGGGGKEKKNLGESGFQLRRSRRSGRTKT